MKRLAFVYSDKFLQTIVYMLQSSEYQVGTYLKWFWRVEDFTKVTYRRELVLTRPARALLAALRAGVILQVLLGLVVEALALKDHNFGVSLIALSILVSAPIVWAHLVTLPLIVGRWLIIKPTSARKVSRSKR